MGQEEGGISRVWAGKSNGEEIPGKGNYRNQYSDRVGIRVECVGAVGDLAV